MFRRIRKTLAGNHLSTPGTRRRGPSCKCCRAPLSGGARRCPRCGTRVPLADSSAGVTVAEKPESIGRLEALILRGALAGRGGSPSVRVLPSRGTVVGEIKVAGERIFGDEAVRAVARLVQDGDLFPLEDGFALTAAGRLRAQSLRV